MRCRNETFKVSGAKSVKRRFCRTVHGPVQATAGTRAYARRYAIWGRELETFVGLAALNGASSVAPGRRRRGEADLEREPARRRRRRPHRLVAPGPAAAAPEALGRAAAAARHRRGRVARAAARQGAPEGDRPAAGLPRQLEQPAVGRAGRNGDAPAQETNEGDLHRGAFLQQALRGDDRPHARRAEGDRAPGRHDRPAAPAARRAAARRAGGGDRAGADACSTRSSPGTATTTATTPTARSTRAWPRSRRSRRPSRTRSRRPRSTLLGQRGGSHPFDMGAAEAAGFHSLSTAGLVRAAGEAQTGAGGALRQRRPGELARAAQALRGRRSRASRARRGWSSSTAGRSRRRSSWARRPAGGDGEPGGPGARTPTP